MSIMATSPRSLPIVPLGIKKWNIQIRSKKKGEQKMLVKRIAPVFFGFLVVLAVLVPTITANHLEGDSHLWNDAGINTRVRACRDDRVERRRFQHQAGQKRDHRLE